MVSERRRTLVRVISNYCALMLMLVLGVMLVRMLIHALGTDGYGLVALLGSSVGLGQMAFRISRLALVRELGSAYHGEDRKHFINVYNTSLWLALLVGLITLGLFGVLYLVLGLFKIPAHLRFAAEMFLISRALQVFVMVVLTPTTNMYLVKERMVANNVIMVLNRLVLVLAALWVLIFGAEWSPSRAIIFFGFVSAMLEALVYVIACMLIVRSDHDLIPRPRNISFAASKELFHTGKWNILIVTAMNLHLRVDAIIMNAFFVLQGNAIFGVAVNAVSLSRRFSAGMTSGLDAVAARLSTTKGDNAVRRLLQQSTRFHALTTFPAAMAIFILAMPMLDLWVGDRIENPAQTLPPIANITRVLMLGTVIRAISDSWVRVLYGAGKIHRIGWTIMFGGLLNPLLAVALIFLLPEPYNLTGPAWSYTGIFFFLNGIVVPRIVTREYQMPLHAIFTPAWRPLLATALAAIPLIVADFYITHYTLTAFLIAGAGFGALYTVLAWCIILTSDERGQFQRAVMSRLRPAPAR